MSVVRRVAAVAGLPALLLALWWVASAESVSFYLPPLRTILEAFPRTWLDGRLGADVLPSVLRLLAGYAIALLAGVTLGLVLGLAPRLRALSAAPLELFRAIPPPVLVPVLMLFLGIGTPMRVAVIATGCLWPVLLNTAAGVRAVEEPLWETARAYRLTRARTIRSVILPAASPRILTGARQALSVGIILMVISEMFAASDGLGFTVVQFQRSFAVPEMWTGILLLGALGVLLSLLLRAVETPVLRWHRATTGHA